MEQHSTDEQLRKYVRELYVWSGDAFAGEPITSFLLKMWLYFTGGLWENAMRQVFRNDSRVEAQIASLKSSLTPMPTWSSQRFEQYGWFRILMLFSPKFQLDPHHHGYMILKRRAGPHAQRYYRMVKHLKEKHSTKVAEHATAFYLLEHMNRSNSERMLMDPDVRQHLGMDYLEVQKDLIPFINGERELLQKEEENENEISSVLPLLEAQCEIFKPIMSELGLEINGERPLSASPLKKPKQQYLKELKDQHLPEWQKWRKSVNNQQLPRNFSFVGENVDPHTLKKDSLILHKAHVLQEIEVMKRCQIDSRQQAIRTRDCIKSLATARSTLIQNLNWPLYYESFSSTKDDITHYVVPRLEQLSQIELDQVQELVEKHISVFSNFQLTSSKK